MRLIAACLLLSSLAYGQTTLGPFNDGIRWDARGYPGADWGAKLASAISSGAKNIVVPASLAGATSTAISIPTGVQVIFGIGTFSDSQPILSTGNTLDIGGAGRNNTILQFTGATDGLQFNDCTTANAVCFRHIHDLTISTSNASAGKAVNTAMQTGAVTNIDLSRVIITATDPGVWTYGQYYNGCQECEAHDVTIMTEATQTPVKTAIYCGPGQGANTGGTKELRLYNEQVYAVDGSNPPTTQTDRILDMEADVAGSQGCDIEAIGGSWKGSVNKSFIYSNVVPTAGGSNYLYMAGIVLENTAPANNCSDGAGIYIHGGVITLDGVSFSAGAGGTCSTVVTAPGTGTQSVDYRQRGGDGPAGGITIGAGTVGAILNAKIGQASAGHSITNNAPTTFTTLTNLTADGVWIPDNIADSGQGFTLPNQVTTHWLIPSGSTNEIIVDHATPNSTDAALRVINADDGLAGDQKFIGLFGGVSYSGKAILQSGARGTSTADLLCFEAGTVIGWCIDLSGNLLSEGAYNVGLNSGMLLLGPGAGDTSISRDAAATIDFGNGTAGDKSGTINAAALNLGSSIKTLMSTGATCMMSAGTTCTVTVPSGSANCGAFAQGLTAYSAACSVSGTTATVTAGAANSATWLVLATN